MASRQPTGPRIRRFHAESQRWLIGAQAVQTRVGGR